MIPYIMAQMPERKWPCLIFTGYLVLAVIGAFTFSIAETFHLDEMEGKKQDSSVFFSPVNHTIDCLAEDSITIGRDKYSIFCLRNGKLHITMPVTQNAGACFAGFSLETANRRHVPILKNAIQLNLRI